MKPVKIGILGLGTVGCGTVNVLSNNAGEIYRRAGREIQIVQALVQDPKKERHCETNGIELVTDPMTIVTNPEIDIVVELIGGETLAKDLVLTAIEHGKHVVTANKALIAKHGNLIFSKAFEKGTMVTFEAAVAGGIPIIKALREGLSGNQITCVFGIINGTCNYILTAMGTDNRSFEDALKDAQDLGYAELDPTFDVAGIDVAHKLTILASIAFGIPLQFDSVNVEGITDISPNDITYAERLGYAIKHLGIARQSSDGIELRVHPTLVPREHTIAHVNGVMNALVVQGDAVGETLFYGAGAGAYPTASSVVADIVDVVRTLTCDPDSRVPHLAFQPDAIEDKVILPMSETKSAYYLRLLAADKSGVLADVSRVLADLDISIESILQVEKEQKDGYIPIVILTHILKEEAMLAALEKIEALKQIKGRVKRIRLEHLP